MTAAQMSVSGIDSFRTKRRVKTEYFALIGLQRSQELTIGVPLLVPVRLRLVRERIDVVEEILNILEEVRPALALVKVPVGIRHFDNSEKRYRFQKFCGKTESLKVECDNRIGRVVKWFCCRQVPSGWLLRRLECSVVKVEGGRKQCF